MRTRSSASAAERGLTGGRERRARRPAPPSVPVTVTEADHVERRAELRLERFACTHLGLVLTAARPCDHLEPGRIASFRLVQPPDKELEFVAGAFAAVERHVRAHTRIRVSFHGG